MEDRGKRDLKFLGLLVFAVVLGIILISYSILLRP